MDGPGGWNAISGDPFPFQVLTDRSCLDESSPVIKSLKIFSPSPGNFRGEIWGKFVTEGRKVPFLCSSSVSSLSTIPPFDCSLTN